MKLKIKVALLFAMLMALQACGTNGSMMHSAVSMDAVAVAVNTY